jgi:hypothetical protein
MPVTLFSKPDSLVFKHQLMRFSFSILLMFLFSTSLFAISSDTIPAKDSLIQIIPEQLTDNLPLISLDDESEKNSSQPVASLLSASRDPFLAAATFSFGFVRFKLRGYDADHHANFINGISMKNLENGSTPFALWGGLNDVMRNRDVNLALNYNTFSFGEIGTSTNIDMRAGKQRKQTSFSYSLSNRNYQHRLSLTHNTGVNKHGWAFSIALAARYAQEGNVPGSFYKSASGYIGIDKVLNTKHVISFVAFAAPTENGRQTSSTMEAINLAGNNYYNPLWGLQNGKVRNASVNKSFQPYAILTHEYKISSTTNWLTSVAITKGERSGSGLDWYNAPDPRPDYYRNLPSFLVDSSKRNELNELIESDHSLLQINWQKLYDINRNSFETIKNADGNIDTNFSGLRSHYIIQDRTDAIKKIAFNSVYNSLISASTYLTAGINYQYQENNYFKKINDLLGGDFYIDLNQFAEQDFPSRPDAAYSDLFHPNHILKTGDKFGYDYKSYIQDAGVWLQLLTKAEKIDLFIAGKISASILQREGMMMNGLFPDNSFGRSAAYIFYNSGLKMGITYKLNGKNYFYLNVAAITRPPTFDNLFISPQTRDLVQKEIRSEQVVSGEAGYVFHAPKTQIRLSGYYTMFNDQMNVLSFYHDDYKSVVNYAFRGINKVHMGGELGVQTKLMRNTTVAAVGAYGNYFYNGRQKAIITLDNDASLLDEELIYSNNYKIPSTPQQAVNISISYRSPAFWFLNLSANYVREMWSDFNPIRRTVKAVDGVQNDTTIHSVIDQQELSPAMTVDFFGGYSWRIPKKMGLGSNVYLAMNAGVNNILNNTGIISSAYEQLRFDFEKKNIDRFPMKYSYAQGLNYFLSVSLRF